MPDYIFNHDGGNLWALAKTGMTEQDAADLLVRPLAESDITAIDWCIHSTAEHNCRTRHNSIVAPVDRQYAAIAKIVEHYNAQPLDVLDIVVKHGHEHGMKVYGNVRLNHCMDPDRLASCPGLINFGYYNGIKKDFRSPAFHQYLCEVFEDLLEKNVDGISLDFERKAPFFPPGTEQDEKYDACYRFLQDIRQLTDKPVLVRVAYDRNKGACQGQDPLGWMDRGLVDVVIPATHNHEGDSLDWRFDAFLQAAKKSPRPCQIWPQIWPTGQAWRHENQRVWHTSLRPLSIEHKRSSLTVAMACITSISAVRCKRKDCYLMITATCFAIFLPKK